MNTVIVVLAGIPAVITILAFIGFMVWMVEEHEDVLSGLVALVVVTGVLGVGSFALGKLTLHTLGITLEEEKVETPLPEAEKFEEEVGG